MKSRLAVPVLWLVVTWFGVTSIMAQQPQAQAGPQSRSGQTAEKPANDDPQELRFRQLHEEFTAALTDAREQLKAAREAQRATEEQLKKLAQSHADSQSSGTTTATLSLATKKLAQSDAASQSLLSLARKKIAQAADADAARETQNSEQQRKRLLEVIAERHQQVVQEQQQRKELEKALAELSQLGRAEEAKELADQARKLGLLPPDSQMKPSLQLLLLETIKARDSDLLRSEPKLRDEAAQASAQLKQAMSHVHERAAAAADNSSDVVPMLQALREEVRALRQEVTELRRALEQRRSGESDQGSATSGSGTGYENRLSRKGYRAAAGENARSASTSRSASAAGSGLSAAKSSGYVGRELPIVSDAAPSTPTNRDTSIPAVPAPEPVPAPTPISPDSGS